MSPAATSEVVDVLRRARLVVFDFDGTLVDSNPIKQRAFARCFAEIPERLEEILAYCGSHHHVPRWDKFRHVYEQILSRPYTPEVAATLEARFDAQTTRQIIAGAEIPGATPFLRMVSRRNPTALLSSTPQETLRRIVEQRGWLSYFQVIQGAPVDKAAWLQRVREERGGETDAVVFFGDSREDAAAAEAAGCRFVGVGTHGAVAGDEVWIPDFLMRVRAPLATQEGDGS